LIRRNPCGPADRSEPLVQSNDSASPAGSLFPLVLAGVVVAVAAPLLVVLERIGVPALLLLGLTASLAMLLVVLGAASGGTMRLPVYLTSGRDLGGVAAGLAFAACLPAPASLATVAWQGLALGLAVLVLAPALRRSGAVSIPTFLASRYGGRSLRLVSALLLVPAACVLGAAGLATAARALQSTLPVGAGAALSLCAVAALVVLVPGGGRSLTRAAVVAGFLLVVSAAVVVGLALWAGLLPGERGLSGLLLAAPSPLPALAGLLAVFAMPQLVWVSSAVGEPADLREAAGWALVATVLAGLSLAAAPAGAGGPVLVFAGIASAVPRVLGTLLAAVALLGSAGLALGYDLPGRRNRRRVSTSRRFAQLRFAMVLAVLAATALCVTRGPDLAIWTELAGAVLVAGVLPPVALTLVRPRAGAGAGFASLAVGLAVAALALDPRIWPAGVTALSPALAGFSAGLLAGLVLSLVVPPARPPAPDGDAAL
jgi:Na+/proline symporter